MGVSVKGLTRMKNREVESGKLTRMYAVLALGGAEIKDLLSRNCDADIQALGSGDIGRRAWPHRGRRFVSPRRTRLHGGTGH